MNEYEVTWTITIDAESPREAAEKALEIQRDKRSCATVFDVESITDRHDAVTIDLWEN